MAAKKNPMQRALDQADAIQAGNRQLENLTSTGSAGTGPLFNDRRGGGNTIYEYHPVGLDAYDPKPFHPTPGTRVRLSNQSGVGQAKGAFRYVEHADTGEFHGMVLKNSLKRVTKKKS